MTETPGPEAPPRRLHRSSTDRMVAGVCGGLADYTGIDPVVFRVVFAVAGLLGGAGIAAYVIAWVVIPEGATGESHAEAILRDRDIPRIVLVAGAVLSFFFLANIVDGPGHRHLFGGGFSLVVLLGLGIWLWMRHDQRPPRPIVPPATPVPPIPPSPLASSPTETTSIVTPPPTVVVPPVPPVQPPTPRPPRERSVLAGVTISAAVLVAGALGLLATAGVDLSAGVILASALIVLGVGLLVGSRWGRARALIPLSLVLLVATAAATVADVPLTGGAGHRIWRPAAAAELVGDYRLGVGHGELDLRGVDLGGSTHHVTATLGMGHLEIWLPRSATVEISSHVGAGRTIGVGTDEGGVDHDEHVVIDGPSGRLVLDAKVGFGLLEVYR